MASPKLQVTTNYRMFDRSIDNRPLDPKKHKRLGRSMKEYGFLPCFPLAVVRSKECLVVYDGQHRLSWAEQLGLAVYYVVLDDPFDIARVNCTQEKWVTRNYAECYAGQGIEAYKIGLEFADRHGIPTGCAFGLLGGTVTWNNVSGPYYSGTFEIKDLEYAEAVGTVYSRLVELAPQIKNSRMLEACMAAARIPRFDPQRLLAGAERCREKLAPYSTRDAYLEMLEDLYNYGRKTLVALKNEAIMAMRRRSAVEQA